MAQMVDKSGQTVEVPDEQVGQAYLSGQYGIPPGQAVHGYDDNGDLRQLAPEQIAGYLQQGGRLATQQEVHAQDLEQRHGGIGGTLAAAGEAAARGISMGLSDPLAVGAARLFGGDEAAEHVRTHLAEEREAHPVASTLGEVAGAAAPLIFTGGASAGAEGALVGDEALSLASEGEQAASVFSRIGDGVRTLGIAPRLASGAGALAEHGIAGLLGSEASTALGRAGIAAAKTAARGVVEGGLFGAGEEISDDTLQNKELTAEKVLAHVGHGALMGGLLGGALGGAGSLAADATKGVVQKLSPVLDDASAEQAWKWLAPKNAVAKEAMARAGGTAAVGREVRDEVLRPLIEEGGLSAAVLEPEQRLNLIRGAVNRTGKEIGDLLANNSEATVKLGDMLDPIDSRISEYSGKILGKDKVRALADLKSSIAEVLGVEMPSMAEMTQVATDQGVSQGLKGVDLQEFVQDHISGQMQDAFDDMSERAIPIGQAIEQRRALQQIVYQETKSLDPKVRVQLLREVSGAWGDMEERALNELSTGKGEELAGDSLAALNKKYQRLKLAEQAAESTTASYAVNRNLSLSDNMYGAAHFGAALSAGHPLGAAAALGTAFGHKLIREHGNAYASILLDRLATFGGVSQAVAEHDEQVASSIESALAAKRPSAVKVIAKKTAKAATREPANDNRYDQEESRIRKAASLGAAAIGAHVGGQLSGLDVHSPGLSKSVQQAHAKALSFLESKLPPTASQQGASLQPQLQQDHASAPDKAKFLRYVDAVEGGPPAIMRRLAKGQITSEDVEALKAVYPQTYQEIRAKTMQACAEKSKPIGYQTRLRLGRLLEFPADPSMTPEFAQLTQKAWAAAPKAEQNAGGPSGKGSPSKGPAKLALAGEIATTTEQATKEEAA